ncbi:MAG: RrF2 family transcriptional regulator [Candidatus Kryptoniota bacterium]
MKLSAQEEYGMRCLLRIARGNPREGMTIPEISRLEGLSPANVAKLLRILRLGGFIESARGRSGGYRLAKPADQIIVGDVLNVLGGRIYEEDFCDTHSGLNSICCNIIDCSMRTLWQSLQGALDNVLNKVSLKDMLKSEQTVKKGTIAPRIEAAKSAAV